MLSFDTYWGFLRHLKCKLQTDLFKILKLLQMFNLDLLSSVIVVNVDQFCLPSHSYQPYSCLLQSK